jgi:glycosyltransferase involved in cell wall biosynthesis|tara:strand:- start:3006 stop:4199 length:1194 start_codon:yes stop_codon:yes gene_type:complete
MVTEDLVVGGAQVFALRLAQALSADYNVYFLVYHKNLVLGDLARKLAPDVPVISHKPFLGNMILLIDRLLFKVGIDDALYNYFVNRWIKHQLLELHIDIIHTHAFKVDYEILKLIESVPVSWIITTHGDHAGFYERSVNREGAYVLNYADKLKAIFQRLNYFVYLTDRQLRFTTVFSDIEYEVHKKKLRKIYNGCAGSFFSSKQSISAHLEVARLSMIYGMVARSHPDKGWSECIKAFERVVQVNPDVGLILVGSGEYLDQLRQRHSQTKNLFFVGYSANPIDWIQIFDVGLLPTRNDNLPTSVIEYLYCGKPVITTDVGEISKMISCSEGRAGFVLQLNSEGKADTKIISNCMIKYYEQSELYTDHCVKAKKAFKKFRMEKCLKEYLRLYQEASTK